jgi:hypothetical protein
MRETDIRSQMCGDAYRRGFESGMRAGYEAAVRLLKDRDQIEDRDYRPPARELEAPLRRLSSVEK